MKKNKYFSNCGNEVLTEKLVNYLDLKKVSLNIWIIADSIIQLSDELSKDISANEAVSLSKDYIKYKSGL